MLVYPSDRAVFAIINEIDKRVYVSYSSRLHQRLGIITSEILAGDWKYPQMIEDSSKLNVLILEQRDCKVFVKFFIGQYKKLGYSIYNDSEKIPLEYKFKMEYTNRNILVLAVNKRNEKEVLGTFKMFEDAQNFLSYIMNNNPTKNLVYSI